MKIFGLSLKKLHRTHKLVMSLHKDSTVPASPSEVGYNYFCDTGARKRLSNSEFYKNDPLWD